VPGENIVMTLVCYSTAFGSTGTEQPAGLAYIIAIGWLTERFETIANVMGDLNSQCCQQGECIG
jgi:Na+/H+-dicarboxylate symporter